MDQRQQDNMDQTDKLTLWTQPREWIGVAVVVGILAIPFFLLSLLAARPSSQPEGWTSYNIRVDDLAVDRQGRVWMADFYNGSVSYWEDGKPVLVSIPRDLLGGMGMTSFTIDKQDQIWIGSWSGTIGMRPINGNWVIYTPEIPDLSVAKIVVDGSSHVWVQSDIGFGNFDPMANATPYTVTDYKWGSYDPRAMTTDDQEQLWLLDGSDLKVLEPDGNWATRAKEIRDTGVTDYIPALAADHRGQVWVETFEGVNVFRPDGTWKSFQLAKLDIALDTTSIVVDNQDRVWVGTQQGLFRIDANMAQTSYTSQNSSLVGRSVMALAADGQGKIWIGTDEGLNVLDAEMARSTNTTQAILDLGSSNIAVGIDVLIGLVFVFIRQVAIRVAPVKGLLRKLGILPSITSPANQDVFIGFVGWFAIAFLIQLLTPNRLVSGDEFGASALLTFGFRLFLNGIVLIVLFVRFYRTRLFLFVGALSAVVVSLLVLLII